MNIRILTTSTYFLMAQPLGHELFGVVRAFPLRNCHLSYHFCYLDINYLYFTR